MVSDGVCVGELRDRVLRWCELLLAGVTRRSVGVCCVGEVVTEYMEVTETE